MIRLVDAAVDRAAEMLEERAVEAVGSTSPMRKSVETIGGLHARKVAFVVEPKAVSDVGACHSSYPLIPVKVIDRMIIRCAAKKTMIAGRAESTLPAICLP